MFCMWCEQYAKDKKRNNRDEVVDNNMIRDTSNFKSSTLTEHLSLNDHIASRDSQDTNSKNKEGFSE